MEETHGELALSSVIVHDTHTMKSTIFWDVVPLNLVEVYRRFRGPYFHLQGQKISKEASSKQQAAYSLTLKIERVPSSETSLNSYQNACITSRKIVPSTL
jgi:hypothetical protein